MLTVVRQRSGASLDKPPEICRGYASRLPWAWVGLCFAVPMHESSSNGLRDVVNNVAPSAVTGGTWTRDSQGNPALTLGTTSWIDYADHPRHDLPSSAITAYVRLKKAGTPTAWGGAFCNVYDPVSSPWTSWLISDAGAADGKMLGQLDETAGTMTTPDTGVIVTTEYLSMFLRWNAVVGANGLTNLRILGERGNTVQDVSSASYGSGVIQYAAGKGVRINGNEPATPASFNASYSQAMIWNRRLTDVELASLVSDPFGWYSPRRETVILAGPYPVWARGGPNVLRSPEPADASVAGPYAQPVSASQTFGG